MKESRENKQKIRRKISKKAKKKRIQEAKARERRLASAEKGALPTAKKAREAIDPIKDLSLSPSAGSQAMKKKLDSQGPVSLSALTLKGVDISNIPTEPKARMQYLRSRFPGLRNNPA